MTKTWADVETTFKDAGISYSLRGWLYHCEIKGRKFYYSPQSGKWRVKGKRAWQQSKSTRDFIAQALRYSPPENKSSQSESRQQKTQKKSSKKKTQNNKQKSYSYSGSEERRKTANLHEIRAEFLDQFGEYLEKQRERNYKIGWIWYCLVEDFLLTPMEICWLSVVFEYSPRWAFYQIQSFYLNIDREVIFEIIDSNKDKWLNQFKKRWGVSKDSQNQREKRTSQTNESSRYSFMYQSYLELLRVSFPLTKQELKSAYRKRALETHPDSGGTASAFREVHAAYEVLSRYV